MTENRFRVLLWVYVALVLLSIVAGMFPSHSAALTAAVENESPEWLDQYMSVVLILCFLFLGAWTVSIGGLYRFKPWARSFSAWSTLVGFAVYPFLGPSLTSGIEGSLAQASSVLWGVLLCAAYFSPISTRFSTTR